MGLLRSLLLDSQMRTTVTPRLIVWIYRGSLAVIAAVSVWWLLVVWWATALVGWIWLVLALIVTPIVDLIAILCVRVACEMAMARFRDVPPPAAAGDDSVATYDGRTASAAPGDGGEDGHESAVTVGAPLALRAGDAARSVIRSLRTQGGAPVTSDGDADAAPPRDDPPGDLDGGAPPDDGSPVQPWWFAAAAGGVVLVALVGLTLIVATGGEDERAAAPSTSGPATVTVTASAPPPAAGAPPAAAAPPAPAHPSPAAPAAPAAPSVRWSGEVRIVASDDRDLDAVPPRLTRRGADVESDPFEKLIKGVGSALVAMAPSGTRPGPQDCLAAAAAGAAEVGPVAAGDVVCLVTGDGRPVRLVVTSASIPDTDPTIVADATVWDVPGATQ